MGRRIDVDVAVIGAGITGLFTALHLARRGKRVVVLERGRAMAEASGVNAGSLGVQNKLLPLVPFALAAIEEWRGIHELLGDDVGFVNAGGWRVAQDGRERDLLRQSSEAQARLGVPITWHEGAGLRERMPALGESVVAATHSPLDSYGSPLRLASALREAAVAAGVWLHERVPVRALTGGGRWLLEADGAEVRAEAVLVAAGPWSPRLVAPLGVQLPMTLDVNMISVTEPGPRVVTGIVFHARGILTVKQVANGTCLIGGGWQGIGDAEQGRREIDYESVLHNIRLATSVVPGLARFNVVRQWAGFEAVTPDALPYFGPVAGHPGLFVAAGTRGGWTLGPTLGRRMAELIATGAGSSGIEAFAPLRNQPAPVHA